MDRLEQQEYIQTLKQSKETFCECILNEIEQYEEELDKLQMQTGGASSSSTSIAITPISSESHIESPSISSIQSTSDNNIILHSQSKHQLISMINELKKQSDASNTKINELEIQINTKKNKQNDINDELQSDIQYLLHVNPSTYNNVKQYIKHMKQQSMARYSSLMPDAPRFSQQIINNKPNNALYRDSRKLPHPPRRNTTVEETKENIDNDDDTDDDIEMLHFVISCLNWKTEPKYKTLRVELLTNDIAPINGDLYQNMMNKANELIDNEMNTLYKLTLDEILVVKLFCECKEFAINFSRAFNTGISSYHRASFYQSAKTFHYIFEYKSIPIAKQRLKHLLPPNINNFGYIVKSIEIGWILDDNHNKKKYLVFNCSEDILMPNDTNKYDEIQYNNDDDHLMMISKFIKAIDSDHLSSNESWNNRVMLRDYGWNNINQLLSSQYLFIEQSSLNNKSLFDILFYQEKLYKMVLNQTFLDRAEINGNVYDFLFNHITLNVDNERNEIIMDLSNANPKIFEYKPSYYKVNTQISFNDDHVTLSAEDSIYQSDKLKWIQFEEKEDNEEEEEEDDEDKPHIYDANQSMFCLPICYLDSILNVNGLLKVIANRYYNREIKNNKSRSADFCIEIEYVFSFGYINSSDLNHECLITSHSSQYLSINFSYLMKIFYHQLIKIMGYSLHSLSQRMEFCSKHKSFIILSLISNYNYHSSNKNISDELSLFDNKSLFEYLFFDCHHYSLCKLFPRNHDLLLKPAHHNNTLIEYNASTCSIILNSMPKLMCNVPSRIIVYLSMDVELLSHSAVKWKEYSINPHLICDRQIIIKNVLCESCINWNNILIKRNEMPYPMILLYYKMECEYDSYVITSTVRNIHISTEIDMELNENSTHFLNEYNDLSLIEPKLIICDNLIIHENAQIYTSFFNLKCNKWIDIRCGAQLIADYRGYKGANITFYNDDNKSDDSYLNRNELIFGRGGNGKNINNDIIHIDVNDDIKGLFSYLGTNDDIKNLVDVFCGGIGTRSHPLQNILIDNDNDCYFISGKADIWFAIDLIFCKISITHYALRHVNVNSCYLRNWCFEAKEDDNSEWQILTQHKNDSTLNCPKKWGIFEIKNNNKYYQYFRVKMNGENSAKKDIKKGFNNILNLCGVFENTANNEYILCCGGFELFGDVLLLDNKSAKSSDLDKIITQNNDRNNGILHFIATNYGRNEWQNPSKSLSVVIERGKQSEKGSVDDIVSIHDIECYFLDYFLIDFIEICIKPNKYSLKLSENENGNCWCIKASNNKINWNKLDDDQKDNHHSFDIRNCDDYYRYFKIENCNLMYELHCKGFEIYGDIKYNATKLKIPQLKCGGNGGGIINLSAPNIKLNNCLLTANGEDGVNGGQGGQGGNVLIDSNNLQLIGENVKIQCLGGKGKNKAENGTIRLFCKNIECDDNNTPQNYCDPKPLIL